MREEGRGAEGQRSGGAEAGLLHCRQRKLGGQGSRGAGEKFPKFFYSSTGNPTQIIFSRHNEVALGAEGAMVFDN